MNVQFLASSSLTRYVIRFFPTEVLPENCSSSYLMASRSTMDIYGSARIPGMSGAHPLPRQPHGPEPQVSFPLCSDHNLLTSFTLILPSPTTSHHLRIPCLSLSNGLTSCTARGKNPFSPGHLLINGLFRIPPSFVPVFVPCTPETLPTSPIYSLEAVLFN